MQIQNQMGDAFGRSFDMKKKQRTVLFNNPKSPTLMRHSTQIEGKKCPYSKQKGKLKNAP